MRKESPNSEELYLGKKMSELNVHEKRFKKLMQLMRIHKMLKEAPKTHKIIPE